MAFWLCRITYLFLRNFQSVNDYRRFMYSTSIIATFFMLKLMDFTLNSMSLDGFLNVGILIDDDAIVVIENIFRHIEMGKTPSVAAKEARRNPWHFGPHLFDFDGRCSFLSAVWVYNPASSLSNLVDCSFYCSFSTIVAFR